MHSFRFVTLLLYRKSPLLRLIFCFLVLLSCSVLTQKDRVDEYISIQMKEKQIPGLALAVLKAGKISKIKGYGFSNVEHKVPVHPNTVFQSGSLGKQFTALAIIQLAEDGKIKIQDPITKYLDCYPKYWDTITIQHLLTHTSGIPDCEDKIDYRRDYTEEDFLKLSIEQPLHFAPGDNWSYSTTGYILLGIIIRKASNMYWGDFIQDRIFSPLGMETARVISESDIIPNRAAGYHLVDGKLKNQEWVSPSINTTADGALYLSVIDMAKWDAALYSEKLITSESRDKMWTPVKLSSGREVNYGYGWAFNTIRGHKIVEHAGHWQGFSSYIARYLDDSLTVVVLANQSNINPGIIAHDVAGYYNPDLRPVERKKITLSKQQLDSYVGQYELPSHLIIHVSREADKLKVVYGQSPEDEFFAESETEFFSTAGNDQIQFFRSVEGKVTYLTYHWGVTEEAKKIK